MAASPIGTQTGGKSCSRPGSTGRPGHDGPPTGRAARGRAGQARAPDSIGAHGQAPAARATGHHHRRRRREDVAPGRPRGRVGDRRRQLPAGARRRGRGAPGLLALGGAGRRVGLVPGTTGKPPPPRLITAALGPLGQEIASNAFGANMEAGLTAALGQAPDAPLAVLETDEKYLPTVLAATPAPGVTLLKLSRGQNDPAAASWPVARRWPGALPSAPDITAGP